MARRILYGVQGEGRGHAARSLQVIQWLMEQDCHVKVLSGGDAMKVLGGRGFDLEEIPLFRYHYRKDGTLDPWLTLRRNFTLAMGLFAGMGRSMGRMKALARSFRPDLIISDFEPFLSRTASRLRLPLLAIDHQHFLTESVLPPLAGLQKSIMLKLYQFGTRLLAGRPDRIITSSFYHFPKKRDSRAVFVGPFIPGKLKEFATRRGRFGGLRQEDADSVTVYLKQPGYLAHMLAGLAARPGVRFQVFSDWTAAKPADIPDNVFLRPIDREAFLSQLARGKALITTAGNQVIGEAVYLRKPVLAFPEPDVLEQELNALALHQSGFGESFRLSEFSAPLWEKFENFLPAYRRRIESHFRGRRSFDGQEQALRALNRYLKELPVVGHLPGKRRLPLSYAG